MRSIYRFSSRVWILAFLLFATSVNTPPSISAPAPSACATPTTTYFYDGTDTYTVKTFTTVTANCTWAIPSDIDSIGLLIVGGGGGAGFGNLGGGGGAGRVIVSDTDIAVTPGQSINISVGAGGAGGWLGSNSGTDWYVGSSGSTSSVSISGTTYTASGGGGGGGLLTSISGLTGGSGGGGNRVGFGAPAETSTVTGFTTYGNDGADGTNANGGGGGGGAGASGAVGVSGFAGTGGAGISLWGFKLAAGGGGWPNGPGGSVDGTTIGGAGAGGYLTKASSGSAGVAGTGSGGGGGNDGGSGRVSIRYLDRTAPVLSATGYSSPTESGTALNFTSDKAGTYYYLVYPAADAAPDTATVVAQGTSAAKASGSATDSANTVTVTGLSSATSYKAYVVVKDVSGNVSLVSTIPFATEVAVDSTAPNLTSLYASAITINSATMNFTSDEAGTYFFLLRPASQSAPDASTVVAQGSAIRKSTGSALASANTIALTSLSAATSYKGYVVVRDSNSNRSLVGVISFSTNAIPDATPPTVTGGNATQARSASVNLNFTSSEVGTYYYLVYPSRDAAPSASTVIAQGASSSKGSGAASYGSNNFTASGLSTISEYNAYVVVRDRAGNVSSVITISFVTAGPGDSVCYQISQFPYASGSNWQINRLRSMGYELVPPNYVCRVRQTVG